MRWLFLILLTVFITSCTFVTDKNPNETGTLDNTQPGIKYLPKDDVQFLKAQEIAQKNIDYFIDELNRYNNSLTYSLKADFIEGDFHEHMWVDVSYYKDNTFFGFVANDPVDVKNYKYGDSVNISKTAVEDWMIWNQETNEYQGYFSKPVLQ